MLPVETITMSIPHSGKIQSTPLPDVLEQLRQSNATGTLTVRSKDIVKSIYVKDGQIVFASSSGVHDRLGEILVKTGKLKRENLDHALTLYKKGAGIEKTGGHPGRERPCCSQGPVQRLKDPGKGHYLQPVSSGPRGNFFSRNAAVRHHSAADRFSGVDRRDHPEDEAGQPDGVVRNRVHRAARVGPCRSRSSVVLSPAAGVLF